MHWSFFLSHIFVAITTYYSYTTKMKKKFRAPGSPDPSQGGVLGGPQKNFFYNSSKITPKWLKLSQMTPEDIFDHFYLCLLAQVWSRMHLVQAWSNH